MSQQNNEKALRAIWEQKGFKEKVDFDRFRELMDDPNVREQVWKQKGFQENVSRERFDTLLGYGQQRPQSQPTQQAEEGAREWNYTSPNIVSNPGQENEDLTAFYRGVEQYSYGGGDGVRTLKGYSGKTDNEEEERAASLINADIDPMKAAWSTFGTPEELEERKAKYSNNPQISNAELGIVGLETYRNSADKIIERSHSRLQNLYGETYKERGQDIDQIIGEYNDAYLKGDNDKKELLEAQHPELTSDVNMSNIVGAQQKKLEADLAQYNLIKNNPEYEKRREAIQDKQKQQDRDVQSDRIKMAGMTPQARLGYMIMGGAKNSKATYKQFLGKWLQNISLGPTGRDKARDIIDFNPKSSDLQGRAVTSSKEVEVDGNKYEVVYEGMGKDGVAYIRDDNGFMAELDDETRAKVIAADGERRTGFDGSAFTSQVVDVGLDLAPIVALTAATQGLGGVIAGTSGAATGATLGTIAGSAVQVRGAVLDEMLKHPDISPAEAEAYTLGIGLGIGVIARYVNPLEIQLANPGVLKNVASRNVNKMLNGEITKGQLAWNITKDVAKAASKEPIEELAQEYFEVAAKKAIDRYNDDNEGEFLDNEWLKPDDAAEIALVSAVVGLLGGAGSIRTTRGQLINGAMDTALKNPSLVNEYLNKMEESALAMKSGTERTNAIEHVTRLKQRWNHVHDNMKAVKGLSQEKRGRIATLIADANALETELQGITQPLLRQSTSQQIDDINAEIGVIINSETDKARKASEPITKEGDPGTADLGNESDGDLVRDLTDALDARSETGATVSVDYFEKGQRISYPDGEGLSRGEIVDVNERTDGGIHSIKVKGPDGTEKVIPTFGKTPNELGISINDDGKSIPKGPDGGPGTPGTGRSPGTAPDGRGMGEPDRTGSSTGTGLPRRPPTPGRPGTDTGEGGTTAEEAPLPPVDPEAYKKADLSKLSKDSDPRVYPRENFEENEYFQANKKKYEESKNKATGKKAKRTAPNGEEISGQWKLVNANDLSPSHISASFYKTPGVPVTPEGTTNNDNDYEKSESMRATQFKNANDYDARAIQNPVFVDKNGVVKSGNGRVMSRQMSTAKSAKKYLEALKERASEFGFTKEQIEAIGDEDVMLVFEVDGEPAYSPNEYAKFNTPDAKAKSPLQEAINIAKRITKEQIARLARYATQGDVASDIKPADVARIKTELVKQGYLTTEQQDQYFHEEGGLTESGKEFLEGVLLATVFNETELRILNKLPKLRRRLAGQRIRLLKNKAKGEAVNIIPRIREALHLINSAQQFDGNIIDKVLKYVSGDSLFEQLDVNPEAVLMTIVLSNENYLRSYLDSLNNSGAGQLETFGSRDTGTAIDDFVKTVNDKLSGNGKLLIKKAQALRTRQQEESTRLTDVNDDTGDGQGGAETSGQTTDSGTEAEGQPEAKAEVETGTDEIPDTVRGRKQVKRRLQELDDADTPIKQLNAINDIRTNTRQAPDAITEAEQQRIDEIESQLKEDGYEIDDLTGQKYVDGLNVIADFVSDENAEPGSKVITRVRKPKILKDGKMVQAAEITVTVGPPIEEETDTGTEGETETEGLRPGLFDVNNQIDYNDLEKYESERLIQELMNMGSMAESEQDPERKADYDQKVSQLEAELDRRQQAGKVDLDTGTEAEVDAETEGDRFNVSPEEAESIDKARAGDVEEQKSFEDYGIDWRPTTIFRFIGKSEVDALLNGERIAGKLGEYVDVTSSREVTTATSSDYRVTFKEEFDYNKNQSGKDLRRKTDDGDGSIMGGYDLNDVSIIEEQNEDGTWTQIYPEVTAGPETKTEGTVDPETGDVVTNDTGIPEGATAWDGDWVMQNGQWIVAKNGNVVQNQEYANYRYQYEQNEAAFEPLPDDAPFVESVPEEVKVTEDDIVPGAMFRLVPDNDPTQSRTNEVIIVEPHTPDEARTKEDGKGPVRYTLLWRKGPWQIKQTNIYARRSDIVKAINKARGLEPVDPDSEDGAPPTGETTPPTKPKKKGPKRKVKDDDGELDNLLSDFLGEDVTIKPETDEEVQPEVEAQDEIETEEEVVGQEEDVQVEPDLPLKNGDKIQPNQIVAPDIQRQAAGATSIELSNVRKEPNGFLTADITLTFNDIAPIVIENQGVMTPDNAEQLAKRRVKYDKINKVMKSYVETFADGDGLEMTARWMMNSNTPMYRAAGHLLNAEYYSQLAKQNESKEVTKALYEIKNNNVALAAEIYADNNWEWGWEPSEIPGVDHTLFFELPDTDYQLSFHGNFDQEIIDSAPEYNRGWDEIPGVALYKIEQWLRDKSDQNFYVPDWTGGIDSVMKQLDQGGEPEVTEDAIEDAEEELNEPPKPPKERKKGETIDLFSEPTEKQKKKENKKKKRKGKNKLEDFGEKIGGARKDLWTEYREHLDEIQNLDEDDFDDRPTSKIFSSGDIYRLVDKLGVHPDNGAILKYMLDELRTKPRRRYGWQFREWKNDLKKILDVVDIIMETDTNYLEEVLNRGKLKWADGAKLRLYQYAWSQGERKLPLHKVNFYTNYKRIITEDGALRHKKNEEKPIAPNYRGRKINGEEGFALDETAKMNKAIVDHLLDKKPERKKVALAIYKWEIDPYNYFIGKKVSGKEPILIKGGFEYKREASNYLEENREELEQQWQQINAPIDERPDANRERNGEDWRRGEDVTPKKFMDTFKFRGGEFGNWVNQTERQDSLNRAYDALMDMADALDISPAALSLDGTLAIAFGARGKGKASAHYEPVKIVINLTKMSGPGSLAHEWWHAFDNYFAKQDKQGETYLSETSDFFPNQTRREMFEAFKNLRRTIQNDTKLPERSKKLDQTRSKDYWSQVREMTARTFENFMVHKLRQNGARNDYLANFIGNKPWESIYKDQDSRSTAYPYLYADEEAKVYEAFQNLFDAVQEGEGDTAPLYAFGEDLSPEEKREIRNARLDSQIQDAKEKLFGISGNLTISGLDPQKLENGAKLIGYYIKKGVYNFSDIIEDLYAKVPDKVADMYDDLRSLYNYYMDRYATDEQADSMEFVPRSQTFDKITNEYRDDVEVEEETTEPEPQPEPEEEPQAEPEEEEPPIEDQFDEEPKQEPEYVEPEYYRHIGQEEFDALMDGMDVREQNDKDVATTPSPVPEREADIYRVRLDWKHYRSNQYTLGLNVLSVEKRNEDGTYETVWKQGDDVPESGGNFRPIYYVDGRDPLGNLPSDHLKGDTDGQTETTTDEEGDPGSGVGGTELDPTHQGFKDGLLFGTDTERDPGGRGSGSGGSVLPNSGQTQEGEESSSGGSGGDGQGGNVDINPPIEDRALETGGENYQFPADYSEPNTFNKKQRMQDNVNALRILNDLIRAGRDATPEEQDILARYVGFGGLKVMLNNPEFEWNDTDEALRPQYEAIVRLVDEFEGLTGSTGTMSGLKNSVQNAHYTAVPVIRGMYSILNRLGFNGGKVLEPSAGIGNFFGAMPGLMSRNSRLHAVEKDPLTGHILKRLYPKSTSTVSGYEFLDFGNNAFDAIISNVPFGNVKVFVSKNEPNQTLKKAGSRIHNYFFIRALEQVKEGGIVAFVTSAGVMDSAGNQFMREYMNDNADFLGALRLPSNAFKGNAGTEVVTDMIFLRKNTKGEKNNPAWINTVQQRVKHKDKNEQFDISFNEYYRDNPENVLGIWAAGGLEREDQMTVLPRGERNLENWIKERASTFPSAMYNPQNSDFLGDDFDAESDVIPDNEWFIKDGAAYIHENGKVKDVPNAHKTKVKPFIELKKLLQEQYRLEMYSDNESDVESNRRKLNRAYLEWRQKFGSLHGSKSRPFIKRDRLSFNVFALEDYDPKTGKATQADILKGRTINKVEKPTSASSVSDAVIISLNEEGKLNLERVAELMGTDSETIFNENYGSEFFMNDEGNIVDRQTYLSGNVKKKLKKAQKLAEKNDLYEANVTALEKVIPPDIPPVDIGVNLGTRWIPTDMYRDFIMQLLGVSNANVTYLRTADEYVIDGGYNRVGMQQWSTDKFDAYKLITAAMHNKTPRATLPHPDDPTGKRRITDEVATQAAKEKIDEIKAAFDNWIGADVSRSDRYAKIYNEKYNTDAERTFDGSKLTIDGMQGITLRPHQNTAIMQMVLNNGGIIDHIVGAGKTLVMIGTAIKMRQLGIANKPVITALKSTVPHIQADAQKFFPTARILAPTASDFKPANRKKLLAKIRSNDYDLIVLSHEQFGAIPQDPEMEREMLQEEIALIEKELNNLIERGGAEDTKRIRKGLETRKQNLEVKIRENQERVKKDKDLPNFVELGIDHVFVDESQQFKNLPYATKMTRVAGLGNPNGSGRAQNMLVAARTLQKMHGGDKGITFSSGTTISNSMVELYLLLKYLRPNKMRELGYDTFDGWIQAAGKVTEEIEFSVTGTVKSKNRLRKFMNVPEMAKLYTAIADVQNDETLDLPKPSIRGGEPILVTVPQSEVQKRMSQRLIDFASQRHGDRDGRLIGRPNMSKEMQNAAMLLVTGLSTKLSVDLRLINESHEHNPNGKLQAAVDNVVKEYNEFDEIKGTQLIFSDIGTPKTGQTVPDLRDYLQDTLGIIDDDLNEIFGDPNEEGSSIPPLATVKKKMERVLDLDPEQVDNYIDLAKEEAKGRFNVYDEIKRLLIEQGIPDDEIAFIHSYKTENQKKALFKAVNEGSIRVLLGSTQKLGTGVNAQERIVAMHHIDASWNPASMTQRNGRGIRQGNMMYALEQEGHPLGKGVAIYNYGTEQTLDAYKYQLIAIKQYAIDQLKRGATGEREFSEDDGENMSAQQFVAILSGNPILLDKAKIDKKVETLQRSKRGHESRQYSVRREIEAANDRSQKLRVHADQRKADLDVVKANSVDENADLKPPANTPQEVIDNPRKYMDMRPNELVAFLQGKGIKDDEISGMLDYIANATQGAKFDPEIIIRGKKPKDNKERLEWLNKEVDDAMKQGIGHERVIGTAGGLQIIYRVVEKSDNKGLFTGQPQLKAFLSGKREYKTTATSFTQAINKMPENLEKTEQSIATAQKFVEEVTPTLNNEWDKEAELNEALQTQRELEAQLREQEAEEARERENAPPVEIDPDEVLFSMGEDPQDREIPISVDLFKKLITQLTTVLPTRVVVDRKRFEAKIAEFNTQPISQMRIGAGVDIKLPGTSQRELLANLVRAHATQQYSPETETKFATGWEYNPMTQKWMYNTNSGKVILTSAASAEIRRAATRQESLTMPLSKLLNYPELFDFDPSLKNVQVEINTDAEARTLSIIPTENGIVVTLPGDGDGIVGRNGVREWPEFTQRIIRTAAIMATDPAINNLAFNRPVSVDYYVYDSTTSPDFRNAYSFLRMRLAPEINEALTERGITDPKQRNTFAVNHIFNRFGAKNSDALIEGAQREFGQDMAGWQATPEMLRVTDAEAEALAMYSTSLSNVKLENALVTNGEPLLLKTSSEKVYGFIDPKTNDIYINPSFINANTPIHEFGHLWIRVIANFNPELAKRLLNRVKQDKKAMDMIRNDEFYKGRHQNDTQVADEVLATLIGDIGEMRFLTDAYVKGNDKSRRARIYEMIKDALQWVREKLGIESAADVAELAVKDLLYSESTQDFAVKRLGAKEKPMFSMDDGSTGIDPETEAKRSAALGIRDRNGPVILSIKDKDISRADLLWSAAEIWLDLMESEDTTFYEKGLELAKESEYYKRNGGDARKALEMAIADRANEIKKSKKLISWVKGMWTRVGRMLKLNMTPDQIQDLTFGQYLDIAATQLRFSNDIMVELIKDDGTKESTSVEVEPDPEAVSDTDDEAERMIRKWEEEYGPLIDEIEADIEAEEPASPGENKTQSLTTQEKADVDYRDETATGTEFRNPKGPAAKELLSRFKGVHKQVIETMLLVFPTLDRAGISVVFHETPDSYYNAIIAAGGTSYEAVKSSGAYHNKTIHINLAKPTLRRNTAIHEAMHPVIRDLLINNKKAFSRFVKDILNDPEMKKKYYDLFANKYYAGMQPDRVNEELLVEASADIIVSRILANLDKVSDSFLERVLKYIKDALGATYGQLYQFVNTKDDFKAFANSLADAIGRGMAIPLTPEDKTTIRAIIDGSISYSMDGDAKPSLLDGMINESNNIDYEQVSKVAQQVISGEAEITRLNPIEERGRIKGGSLNVEAALIIGADQRANPDKYVSGKSFGREIDLITEWAMEQGHWMDFNDASKDFDVQVGKGAESLAYLMENGKVRKFWNPAMFYPSSLLTVLDNRIALHNYIFEDTAYEVIGFTERDGGFNIVMEQPFIAGKVTYDPYLEGDKGRKSFRDATDKIQQWMVATLGVQRNQFDRKATANEQYVFTDFHADNVLRDDSGVYHVIDSVIKLNETFNPYIGSRVSGSRTYMPIDVFPSEIQFSMTGDKRDALKRKFEADILNDPEFNWEVIADRLIKSGKLEKADVDDIMAGWRNAKKMNLGMDSTREAIWNMSEFLRLRRMSEQEDIQIKNANLEVVFRDLNNNFEDLLDRYSPTTVQNIVTSVATSGDAHPVEVLNKLQFLNKDADKPGGGTPASARLLVATGIALNQLENAKDMYQEMYNKNPGSDAAEQLWYIEDMISKITSEAKLNGSLTGLALGMRGKMLEFAGLTYQTVMTRLETINKHGKNVKIEEKDKKKIKTLVSAIRKMQKNMDEIQKKANPESNRAEYAYRELTRKMRSDLERDPGMSLEEALKGLERLRQRNIEFDLALSLGSSRLSPTYLDYVLALAKRAHAEGAEGFEQVRDWIQNHDHLVTEEEVYRAILTTTPWSQQRAQSEYQKRKGLTRKHVKAINSLERMLQGDILSFVRDGRVPEEDRANDIGRLLKDIERNIYHVRYDDPRLTTQWLEALDVIRTKYALAFLEPTGADPDGEREVMMSQILNAVSAMKDAKFHAWLESRKKKLEEQRDLIDAGRANELVEEEDRSYRTFPKKMLVPVYDDDGNIIDFTEEDYDFGKWDRYVKNAQREVNKVVNHYSDNWTHGRWLNTIYKKLRGTIGSSLAIADLSYFAIQGYRIGTYAIFRDPKGLGRAFWTSLKTMQDEFRESPGLANDIHDELVNNKYYDRLVNLGLLVTSPDAHTFVNEMVSNDDFFDDAYEWSKGKKGFAAKRLRTYLGFRHKVKMASNAAFATYLNMMSMSIATQYIENHKKLHDGHPPSDETLRLIIRDINNSTGRPNLEDPKYETALRVAQGIMWAPRLYLAQTRNVANVVRDPAMLAYYTLTKDHDKAKAYKWRSANSMMFAGVTAALFALRFALAKIQCGDKAAIGQNKDKSSWLKIECGEFSFDPTGNHRQWIKMGAGLLATGRFIAMEQPKDWLGMPVPTKDQIWQSLKYKMNPALSFGIQMWEGGDFLGRRQVPGDESLLLWKSRGKVLINSLIPIFFQNAHDVMKATFGSDDYRLEGLMMAEALLGFGVQYINEEEQQERDDIEKQVEADKAKKRKAFFKEKYGELPDFDGEFTTNVNWDAIQPTFHYYIEGSGNYRIYIGQKKNGGDNGDAPDYFIIKKRQSGQDEGKNVITWLKEEDVPSVLIDQE